MSAAGSGMGGVFAESDMDSLAQLAQANGVPLKVLSAARDVNHNLADRLVEKIAAALNSVENKDVGILGLAFKPNTNSVAGSSCDPAGGDAGVRKGARVRAYRSGGAHGCQDAAEWVGALLRFGLRGGGRNGCTGCGHGLAEFRARIRTHQASAEEADYRGYKKPVGFGAAAAMGFEYVVRGARVRLVGGEEVCDPATPCECVTLYSRVCFFLSGVLDSFSFSLFCFTLFCGDSHVEFRVF